MTTSRIKRMLTLLAMLAAAAVFAVGCGDDDDDNGGGGGGGVGNTTQQEDTSGSGDATDVPGNQEEAADRCREEAEKLEGQAKETAEAACESIESGNQDKVKEEAKEQCLDAAKQIPDEAARKQAEQSCELLDE